MKIKIAKAITQGFSLIEMMVVITLLSVLLTLSVPAFDLLKEQQMQYQARRLLGSIQFAKNEAFKRNRLVQLCRAGSSTTCSPADINTTERMAMYWVKGWLIYVDDNRNDLLDTDEEIIRYYPLPPGQRILEELPGMEFHPNGQFERTTLTSGKILVVCKNYPNGQAITIQSNTHGSRFMIIGSRTFKTC